MSLQSAADSAPPTRRETGESEPGPLIVVVGRSNYRKSSSKLESLVGDLSLPGSSIAWFETRGTQTARFLDDCFERRIRPDPKGFFRSNTTAARLIRKALKSAILLGHPRRWVDLPGLVGNTRRRQARELRGFIERQPVREVILYAHSAGGIVASMASAEEKVKKLVCFGYPFRHPQKDEEPERTAHLETLRKPFLIFQGTADAYGTPEVASRYRLSPSIRICGVDADHDYENLDARTYAMCIGRLREFLA